MPSRSTVSTTTEDPMTKANPVVIDTKLADLLPCPFCRGEAEALERHNPMSKWRWSVDCKSSTCGMSGPVEASRTEAIIAWNTRPSPTDADAPEGLAGEDDLCDDCPPVGYPTDKTRCLPCPRRHPTADADGLALLRDIRNELPQVCMLIDSIRQEWEPSGNWSEWDQGRRSALTDFMHRIDAHLGGQEQ
jgi:Lar family restriction alleviation protein